VRARLDPKIHDSQAAEDVPRLRLPKCDVASAEGPEEVSQLGWEPEEDEEWMEIIESMGLPKAQVARPTTKDAGIAASAENTNGSAATTTFADIMRRVKGGVK
jgi:hypothetical protein